jgi:hypothetical protein
MSKPVDLPSDQVKLWPLVLGLVLLAFGAFLNRRLGNNGTAMVLAALAVVIPVVGFCCRSYFSTRVAPRIRRVYVDEEPHSIRTVALESAKYLTPPPRPGLPESVAEPALLSMPDSNWMPLDAESAEE